MTSNDETGPNAKRIKHDRTEPVLDVRDMNKLFPKIDNLEHFPLKVLLNIFKSVDYMDLYNLAETSCRFEKIAKIILNERYSHEYFHVDDYKHAPDTNIDFFERFGCEIRAIKARYIKISGEDNWFASVLDKAKNLEKLAFNHCQITSNRNLLQRHVNENITHLTLHDHSSQFNDFILSKFCNLKKLRIENSYYHQYMSSFGPSSDPFNTLEEIVRNNPALESLVIDDQMFHHGVVRRQYPFDRVMKLVSSNLKQLQEFAYVIDESTRDPVNRQPDHIVNHFVHSFKLLESLSFSKSVDSFTDFTLLLARLNSQNPDIKHLKLYSLDREDKDLIQVVASFERLESLVLSFTDFDCKNEIEFMVENLPFLCQLEIEVREEPTDLSFSLVLLRKNPALEILTVASDVRMGDVELFGTSQFYTQFIDSIQNRNVKIQVKEHDEIIGSITKEEVIWRNKLLHWVGYDASKNLSNIHLLDLAKRQSNAAAAATNVEQLNPFDLILGYLDLKSLHSLSQANEKCSQLVENYMKQHSEQNGTFFITNELLIWENGNYDGLEMFSEYVINLRVNLNNENSFPLHNIIQRFRNLETLCVHCEEFYVQLFELIGPQVRHSICDGNIDDEFYSLLYELSRICPDLETIKLNVRLEIDNLEKKDLKFRKLKKITIPFSSKAVEEVKNLKALLKHMNTKLLLNC